MNHDKLYEIKLIGDTNQLTSFDASILEILKKHPEVFAIAPMCQSEKERKAIKFHQLYTTGHRQCVGAYGTLRPKQLYAHPIFDFLLEEVKAFVEQQQWTKNEWIIQMFLDDHENVILQYQWDGRHGITVKGITYIAPVPTVMSSKRPADDRYPSYDEYVKRFKAYHCLHEPTVESAEDIAASKERMKALYDKWHADEDVEKWMTAVLHSTDLPYIPFSPKVSAIDKKGMSVLFCWLRRMVMELNYAVDFFCDDRKTRGAGSPIGFQVKIITDNPSTYIPKYNANCCFLPTLTEEEKEAKLLHVFKILNAYISCY